MEETAKHAESRVSAEYFGLFPTVLFTCSDYTPMHFVISLRDTSEQCLTKIVRLMQHCGADVTLNVSEAADYSVVISDHNDGLDFYGPTFDMEFVKQCLNQLKLLDISKYRSHYNMLPKDANCMDVVYYKRLGWKALIQGKKRGIKDDLNTVSSSNFKHEISDSTSEDDYTKESIEEPRENWDSFKGKNRKGQRKRRNDDEKNLNSDESCNKRQNKKSQASTSKAAATKWHFEFDSDDSNQTDNSDTRAISDGEDDLSLLAKRKHKQCIVSTALSGDRNLENYSQCDNLEGWNENEENVEKFVAHVGDIISRRDFSCEEVERRKKNTKKSKETIYSDESLFESCPGRSKTAPAAASVSQTANRWRFLNEFCSDDDDDDDNHSHQSDKNSSIKRENEQEQIEAGVKENSNTTHKTQIENTKPSQAAESSSSKPNEKEQIEADGTGNSNIAHKTQIENKKPSQTAESSSSKGFFDYGFGSDDIYAKQTVVNRSAKRSRMPYTHEERVKILEYITAHDEYSRIKGRDLWIIMERRKICPSRTWQSMKEHFLKKILYSLDEFTFLTKSQKHKIRNTCF